MTERILVDNLSKGSQEGFVAVYHYFYKPLHFFVLRYVKKSEYAEEILTDIFMKVWERRTEFTTPDGLRAFLYITAKNASLNVIRTNKISYSFTPLSEIEELFNTDGDTFTKIVQVELIQSIFLEVERLPARQRDVFKMTFEEDKTVDEIAMALDMTTSAVYTNRSRAISTIKELMKVKNALSLLVFFQLFMD